MGSKGNLTQEEKEKIIRFRKKGLTINQISMLSIGASSPCQKFVKKCHIRTLTDTRASGKRSTCGYLRTGAGNRQRNNITCLLTGPGRDGNRQILGPHILIRDYGTKKEGANESKQIIIRS